ncbi:FRG domain-containing protein [Acidithiobacillus albertensis]|uniref:FRG domain-containing protein n=1 Tax=Acidithiobacillus albertensis TaxID=119978 RepID=UPI000981F5DD|nr:FRG domain-containing protein [Acidithiobacillus albertensis]
MLDYETYIWRGQRESKYDLASSFDRLLRSRGINVANPDRYAREHLNRFILSARGRVSTLYDKDDQEKWWAIGQHNGLATPLLDWTKSPFVALYFAFENDVAPESRFRSVWALSSTSEINKNLEEAKKLNRVHPVVNDNNRLTAQSALFTKPPLGVTVDEWVKNNYHGESGQMVLIKIDIPDKERDECLRTLNRMNINSLTLFPDLYGSCKHCNISFKINKYW